MPPQHHRKTRLLKLLKGGVANEQTRKTKTATFCYSRKREIKTSYESRNKRAFETLAKELIRLEIFNNLDLDNLARYLDSRDQYIKIVRLLRKTKPEENFKKYANIQRTKNLLFNECRSAASDLGLTITARLKLVIPKVVNDRPKTEAEKRFGDRL